MIEGETQLSSVCRDGHQGKLLAIGENDLALALAILALAVPLPGFRMRRGRWRHLPVCETGLVFTLVISLAELCWACWQYEVLMAS